MANLDEAGGQDVEEEAADELVRAERDGLAVLGGKADGVVVDGHEALIGDADAVGVAAEVAEDLLRRRRRALGVDDPVPAVERVEQLRERAGVGEVGDGR